jgi:sterol desaturase/sphingolipid hydroxylase (fatty acid hydroxylase superfamily)
MWFLDFFSNIFEHFSDPKKRIFLGYIFISIGIAFFWLILQKKLSLRQAFWKIFDKKVFFSKSSKSDYSVFVINRIFTLFISPLLLTQMAIATIIFHLLHKIDLFNASVFSNFSKVWIVLLFTVFVFILDDITKYFVHRWMHKWPILWSLHKVHHSATKLTPLTIYRTHPLEGIVFSLRGAFTQGTSISIFVYLFGNSVDLITILGVNIIVFTFNIAGSNLRHSHIGIRYWNWLEYIFISPAQHQLHHSIAAAIE